MGTDHLTVALRNCTAGLYPLEAGVALLISNGTFLRCAFTSRFIETGTSISDGAIPMAAIDWDAAIATLNSGGLPCSAANAASSNSPPASQAAPPSTCATPSPDSTTTTPPDSSRRYGTQPRVVIYDS